MPLVEPPAGEVDQEEKQETTAGLTSEKIVWEALRSCFDPEIPVNIVDLGLIYDLKSEDLGEGKVPGRS
jgi:metal-sulfur cluster biosynthetic enzyme